MVYRSNLILTIERRYIELFEKVDFEKKKSADDKNYDNG